MSGIIGSICYDEKDLKMQSSKRRKAYIEESIKHNQVEDYKRNDWQIFKQYKTKTRMRKPKSQDVLFEDRIWMIFYNLGFCNMNKDRNCKLKFNGYTKQIDVLARDNDNVFVVDCTCSQSEEIINAKSKLEWLVGKKEDIQRAIKSEWGRDCGRINIVVVISSQDKRKDDENYVIEKKNKNILLWSKKDIKYIEDLISQVGSTAKYQLYSVIFSGKRQRNLKKNYLALQSKIGGRIFYSFLISGKELLQYAYIHHRKLTGILDASKAYQRMLKSTRLKQISKFIDEEDGYFPNSVIVNFTKQLQWNKKEKIDDVSVGTVTLPEYYGCAWIIDGQHRLYGIASAKNDIIVPVLAFDDMEQIEQANLFVDINEKQKKVPAELLWDLYSDIYRDSTDEKQKFDYQIAETAKKINDSGPLKGYIDIPSIPISRPIKLSLTTVCDTIKKYSPWDYLKHPNDENKTPEYAARIINSYFNILKLLWPEDWEKGNNGVIISNNGFGVFIMIFSDIINHLVYKQRKDLLKESKQSEFKETIKVQYLKPVIEYLKKDKDFQKNIKKLPGRGPQSDNAGFLDLRIQEFITDFNPPRMKGEITTQKPEEPPAILNIEEKASIAEFILREFVLNRLKRTHGNSEWWKLGITSDIKRKADEKWKEEINRKAYISRKIKDQNERKFEFIGLGELVDVICYKNNWEKGFQNVFMNKSQLIRRIKDISVLRNPVSHKRQIDNQDVTDGIGGLLWLSNCINKPELNPYF